MLLNFLQLEQGGSGLLEPPGVIESGGELVGQTCHEVHVFVGQILDALVEFTASEACLESICGDQFYSWTGLDPIEDAAYDPVRKLITILGYTEEDIFGG